MIHVCDHCGIAFKRRGNRPRRFCSQAHHGAHRTRPGVERFWEKVDRGGGPAACWTWGASCDPKGYGQFNQGNHVCEGAHIIAWELTHGPIPAGLCVLHRCDNPPCVNPAHLFLGTIADNNADMMAKGRHARGSGHGNARLTEDGVMSARAMRREGRLYREIGAALGVSEATIRYALQRGWRHVA